jgi:hypothetical protein
VLQFSQLTEQQQQQLVHVQQVEKLKSPSKHEGVIKIQNTTIIIIIIVCHSTTESKLASVSMSSKCIRNNQQ